MQPYMFSVYVNELMYDVFRVRVFFGMGIAECGKSATGNLRKIGTYVRNEGYNAEWEIGRMRSET